MERKRKVSYFYDSELGDFYYGPHHPMKPHRVRMAHDLIVRYGLYSHLQVFQPVPAQLDDMAAFHNREYLEYLTVADRGKHPGQSRLAGNQEKMKERFNLGADCPVFEHIFRYCQAYTGASIGAAVQLNYQQADIAINWSGGLHHARKSKASGFCYVNDIVLAILELLKYHQRVLYLDIDIHHGDGVEEAFLTTDRVMTVSFHKYGDDFFPGTGDLDEVGEGTGRYYSVNVPLKDGMDDDSFEYVFKPIMREVMERFRPEAVVLQSGADSLAGDRLGKFNLTIKGHAACHKFMMSFGVPLLVLGGGGYKIKNVARCWAYETAVLLGEETNMSPELPPNEYYELFKPEYSLHIQPVQDLANANSRKQLDQIKQAILERLRHVRPVNASQPLEQGLNGRQVLSDVTLQQVAPGVRDMQMLQQRATGTEFVADNMQPA